ncbi:MAG: hypothetical protein HYU00_01905 [Nitrosarchaeum sp.]|nr:hypothetical protein [Nitrosarchaeum sp.]
MPTKITSRSSGLCLVSDEGSLVGKGNCGSGSGGDNCGSGSGGDNCGSGSGGDNCGSGLTTKASLAFI